MELKDLKLKEAVYVTEMETSYLSQQYFVSLDGKQWKVKEVLYLLIKSIKEEDSTKEFLEKYKEKFGNEIDIEAVENMVDSFLVRRGFIIGTNDTVKKNNINTKSKYLWGKVPLFKRKYVEKLKFFSILYFKPCVIFFVLFIGFGIIYASADLIKSGFSITRLLNISISDSIEILIVFFFAALFHEIGHMSYLLKNNIQIGHIGFAFYYISPVFYSDVSMAWKMTRKKRQVLDIGGIYFQSVFLSGIGCIGIVLNRKSFILAFVIGMVYILNNLNPFLKMDGYWLVSDYLGIPNLHKKTSMFFEEQIMRIFQIRSKTQKFLCEVNEKERRQFILYSLLVAGYMIVFYLSLFKVSCDVTSQLVTNVTYLIQTQAEISEIVNYVKQDFILIFTGVLLIRILIITLLKVCSACLNLYKVITDAKRG